MTKFTVMAVIMSIALSACSEHREESSNAGRAPVIDLPPGPTPAPVPNNDIIAPDQAEKIGKEWQDVMSNQSCDNEYFGFSTDTYKVGSETNFRTNEIRLNVFEGEYYNVEIKTIVDHYDGYSSYTTNQYLYQSGGWESVGDSMTFSQEVGNLAKVELLGAGTEYPQLKIKFVEKDLKDKGLTGPVVLVSTSEKCQSK